MRRIIIISFINMQVESNVVAEVKSNSSEAMHVVKSLTSREPERARLLAKLKKVQEEASRMEVQGESLLNTVVDLRKLVKLVEKERHDEL